MGVGAAALAIRQVVPVGVNVIGLQLGYFASYIFLFCLGIAAWRHDWLRQLKWNDARSWVICPGRRLSIYAGDPRFGHLFGAIPPPLLCPVT
jgi:hypothetical protein